MHGGAVPRASLGTSHAGRQEDDSPGRTPLVEAILARLRPGQVLGLDAGTTTTALAERLPRDLEITVATNGPTVASALADHPSATVLLLGGELDLRWMAATGSSTVDAIRDLRLDVAVVGVCGFELGAGLTTRSLREVHTKRAFIGAAAETIVPLEGPKVGVVGPFRVSGASEVSLLFDPFADSAFVDAARDAGLDVEVVDDRGRP